MSFESDAIDHGSVHAVGDGVTALNGAPGIELRRTELRLLVGMPANACRIKNGLCATERSEARAFGIPLVPADLHADARVLGVEIWEAQIARREIKLFVIQGIVGNVHLAIFSEKGSVGIQNGASVVVNARRAALEKGHDECGFFLFGDLR